MTDYIQTELLKNQLKSQHQTNHILHLILSIFTFGFWLIVWLCVTMINSRKREDIDDRFLTAMSQDMAKK